MKSCSALLVIREMQVKNKNKKQNHEITLHTQQKRLKLKTTDDAKCWWGECGIIAVSSVKF